MKNTYVKCADWSWEDKLLYIKACIGEDMPHEKFCVYVGLSKDELLSLYRDAWYIYCCDNGMIVYDGKTNNPVIGSRVEIKLSDLKQEKPTKFVKVEESIFDLKAEFERGELFTKKAWGEYVLIKEDTHLASLYEMQSHENSKIGIYRQVEIDWRDELDSYLDSISSLDSNFDEKVTFEFSKSKFAYNISDDEFVAVCHLVASLTDEPE